MSSPARVVVLFDVNNTLLDNDAVQADLSEHRRRLPSGRSVDRRYWRIRQL